MAKTTYKVISYPKLTGFMKKFSSIEKSLLFEITDGRIIAKTHTPDKSVVKISSMLITDIMDVIGEAENVKIALFSVDNFINSFKNFGEAEIKLEIKGEQVSKDNVATELKAFSKNLRISYSCASTSMFRYIDANLAANLTDTKESIFSFRIDKETMSKISSLSSSDADNDILTIVSKGGKITFRGKSFEFDLEDVTVKEDGEISFYKSHFGFVDKEDSEVFVKENKTIFKSLDTDTQVILGRVE